MFKFEFQCWFSGNHDYQNYFFLKEFFYKMEFFMFFPFFLRSLMNFIKGLFFKTKFDDGSFRKKRQILNVNVFSQYIYLGDPLIDFIFRHIEYIYVDFLFSFSYIITPKRISQMGIVF